MRLPNHANKMNAVLDANRTRKFKLGEWDCCIFAAEVVKAITGEDKIAEFRGQYTDKKSYVKLLREKGRDTLLETAKQVMGDPIPRSKTQRGDVVFHKGIIGICTGKYATFVGEGGYILTEMHNINIVFGVE